MAKAFWAVVTGLTFILSLSAVLKVHLLVTDPFADVRTSVPAFLIVASTLIELFAAITIFGSRHPRMSFAILAGVFSLFLIVSMINVLYGANRCACGGALQLPPAVFLVIDILALVALGIVRPAIRHLPNPAWPKGAIQFALGITTVFAVYGLANHTSAGREWLAANFSNRELLADGIDVGRHTMESTVSEKVDVQNVGPRAIQIVGTRQSCTCVVPGGFFPIEVMPGTKASVPIHIKGNNAGPMHQRLRLFLDCRNQPYLDVEIFGSFH